MIHATLALALLSVGFQASKTEQASWVTEVSQSGQFTVEMPTKATRNISLTEESPKGRFHLVGLLCEQRGGATYLAERITFDTQFPPTVSQSLLDLLRDYFVHEFAGEIQSEKRLRLDDGSHGRDFTIKSFKGGGGQVVTYRVRIYLSGQAFYATLAGSVPGRELPDDVGRFFGSFRVGTKLVVKKGYNETKGVKIDGWGEGVDPEGDCKIHLEGKALVMDLPAKLKDLNADIDVFNSPRIVRQVEGDFAIQVKVSGDFRPGTKPLRSNAAPYQGGAIYVWSDERNYVSLHRGAVTGSRGIGTFAMFVEIEGGGRGAMHNVRLEPGTTYLRLERRGQRLSAFVSNDGKFWTPIQPIDINQPRKLTVGVFAVNTSDAPHTVRFEDLSIQKK